VTEVGIDSDDSNIAGVNFTDQAQALAAPGSGHTVLYVRGGILYIRPSGGAEVAVGGVVALTEGKLAVGDASDLLSALDLGTEGDVLTADANGAPVWTAPEAPAGGGGAGHVCLMGMAYSAQPQGTWGITNNATSPYQTYWSNSSQALDDEIDYQVYLEAGTWTLVLLYAKNTTAGIIHFFLDATEIGTIDGYGSLSYDERASITGIVVSTGALFTLKLQAHTKNASASAYKMNITAMFLFRTA